MRFSMRTLLWTPSVQEREAPTSPGKGDANG